MTILLNIFIIAACFNIWNTMAMNPYTMQSNFEQTYIYISQWRFMQLAVSFHLLILQKYYF